MPDNPFFRQPRPENHLYSVARYVERNALLANLVEQAEDWRWGSLWRRVQNATSPLLSDWPVPLPCNWRQLVNQPQTEAEVAAVRRSLQRNGPYSSDAWTASTATALGLQSTLRHRGRPRLEEPE